MLYNAPVALPTPDTTCSIIDILYHAASEGRVVKHEDMQEQFGLLCDLADNLPSQTGEDLVNAVCKLCDVVERVSFAEGVKIGFQLGKELTQ